MLISRTPLVSDDLDSFQEYWPGIPQEAQYWKLSASLRLRLGLWVIGRRTIEVKCHLTHIMSRLDIVSLTQDG